MRRRPRSTLFPYTTLFRSLVDSDDRFEGLQRIDSGTVIFTAHGVSPQVKDRAAAMGLRCVDATCSDVVRTRSEGTRLNSSHVEISYAVFCLKKKRRRSTRP